jgi:hypothetical protein
MARPKKEEKDKLVRIGLFIRQDQKERMEQMIKPGESLSSINRMMIDYYLKDTEI